MTAVPCETSTAAAADQRCSSGLGSPIPSRSNYTVADRSRQKCQQQLHVERVGATLLTPPSDASSDDWLVNDFRACMMSSILAFRRSPISYPDQCDTITHSNKIQNHSDAHPNPRVSACCSSPTPMQAPSRRRHQCRSLMHASPHIAKHNHTVLSHPITSHRHSQQDTRHTTHTPASPRHSR